MTHDPSSGHVETGLKAQAQMDEPLALKEGRSALAELLARFAGYEFALQCAGPT
jgi:hypothetical protein